MEAIEQATEAYREGVSDANDYKRALIDTIASLSPLELAKLAERLKQEPLSIR